METLILSGCIVFIVALSIFLEILSWRAMSDMRKRFQLREDDLLNRLMSKDFDHYARVTASISRAKDRAKASLDVEEKPDGPIEIFLPVD